MINLDEELVDIRDDLRKLLIQYRNDKGLRTNLVTSLWMINRIIDIHNTTKSLIEHKKLKQKQKQK